MSFYEDLIQSEHFFKHDGSEETEEESQESTIPYEELPERTQKKIDRYPEEQRFTIYIRARGKGYEVSAISPHLLDLVEAQGGMGKGWLRVTFPSEQDDDETREGVVQP